MQFNNAHLGERNQRLLRVCNKQRRMARMEGSWQLVDPRNLELLGVFLEKLLALN